MKRNIILLIITILLIPIVVLSFKYKTKSFFAKPNEKKQIEEKTIKLKDEEAFLEINIEDYIIGVVACEMPASFFPEALKAQAVASRTYALKKMEENKSYDIENSTDNQCYLSVDEMKEKWGENFNKYYNKISNAVESTKGECLTYNGDIITAFYFAMSNGYTEESQYVFNEKLPYIKNVTSPWETTHKNFVEKNEYTEKEFLNKLKSAESAVKNIEILNKTKTGRVDKIKINNKIYKGVEFRRLLNLKSTDFKITKKSNKIVIETKGYGHGVGMSQYGANGLAAENKTYKEILNYYYKNIDIKNV